MPLVLLADDNADLRKYILRLLSPLYKVKAVADGDAAWTALQDQPPNLILADVMMPKLDGFGLLTRVREDARFSLIPFVLLSARAGEDSKVEGLTSGADDYLIKPFSAPELLARIKVNLEKSSLRLESARSEERLRAAKTLNIFLLEENRRKDEFLAVLADQLRNPLSVISGVVKIALDGNILPDAVQILDHHLKRLIKLTDDLLERSRLDKSN
jgi:DNA-binding response OmpR family regulator